MSGSVCSTRRRRRRQHVVGTILMTMAIVVVVAEASEAGRTTSSSSVISTSTSRLPMSLSSVISDLEAEGVTRVTCIAVLSSSSSSRSSDGLESLWNVVGVEAGDSGGTALGIRVAHWDEEEDKKAGWVVAPVAKEGPLTAVATVQACRGNVVQVVAHPLDLQSGQLFASLAPALEASLSSSSSKWNLVVVLPAEMDPTEAEAQWKAAATLLLESLAATTTSTAEEPPTSKPTLTKVFASLRFVHPKQPPPPSPDVFRSFVHTTPQEAAKGMSQAIALWNEATTATTTSSTTPLSIPELTALRCFGHYVDAQVESTLETIHHLTGASGGTDETTLQPQYGNLCNAALEQGLQRVNAQAHRLTSTTTANAAFAAAIRRVRDNYASLVQADIQRGFELQVAELQKATYEQVKRGLSRLRLTPNLPADMQAVVQDALLEFQKVLQGGLCPTSSSVATAHAKARRRQLAASLREYVALRLQAAQADGKFRPPPRKGIQVGLHWLLPKPFGNDYRQEPWLAHTTRNIVHVPPDKITEVDPEAVGVVADTENYSARQRQEVDWRRAVVPHPPSADMTYCKLPQWNG